MCFTEMVTTPCVQIDWDLFFVSVIKWSKKPHLNMRNVHIDLWAFNNNLQNRSECTGFFKTLYAHTILKKITKWIKTR